MFLVAVLSAIFAVLAALIAIYAAVVAGRAAQNSTDAMNSIVRAAAQRVAGAPSPAADPHGVIRDGRRR